MSMSTYVVGIRLPDDKWEKMKAVYDACAAADVEIPDEVERFFAYEKPDAKGVVIPLTLNTAECLTITNDQEYSRTHYEVDLKKLPQDVTVVRFTNAH